MKVIDLLNMIVKGEEVPKKVRVLDQTLLPGYQIITWNEDLNLYEYCDGCEFDRVLDKHHLNHEVEIIVDIPKEDLINHLANDCGCVIEDKNIEKLKILPDNEHYSNRILYGKINEIIDRLNGE